MDRAAEIDGQLAGCQFCGLPVPGASDGAQADEPRFCCYGCQFAAAIAGADGDEGLARWAMTRLGLSIFFAMNVMVFTFLLWSQDSSPVDQLSSVWYDLARYACLLFTAPVVLLLGGPLAEDALAELRRGRASISLLLVVGVGASLAYSVYSLLAGDGHVYFEVAATILVAYTLGRWLEATGKLKTTEALRGLSRLLPDEVCLVDGCGQQNIPVGQLRVGDRFRVLPGGRIAADGEVVEFAAAVDEQVITGESLAVLKQPGDLVRSGAIVLDGPLVIRASSSAGEGTLARVIAAVTHATAARTRFERLAEKIAQWFLPAVSLTAFGTLVVHAWLGDPAGGLLAALAVLVIACPCALGLATPMALWAAIGRAAQAGVLIRDGDAFQPLARAKTVCFDKTGTLTTGAVEVNELEVALHCNEQSMLQFATTLAATSTHPLATAIVRYAAKADLAEAAPAQLLESRSSPGGGIVGRLAGIDGPVLLGSRAWLAVQGQNFGMPQSSADSDQATLAETMIAWEGQIRGRFLLRDDCRPESIVALKKLQRAGLHCVMLTGDRQTRGAALAKLLGIECRAQLLPEDKLAVIAQLQTSGPVVMVGDGINDAPALAAADVGVALASGTDISRHAAGVCLLGNDLTRLPWLFRLARQTVRTIHWNLVWAFAYNVAGIGLAAAGWLHPIVAALAMGASSLLVVANSLLLAQYELDSTVGRPSIADEHSPTPRTPAAQTVDSTLAGAAS